ncbi:ribosomal protein L14E [Desulfotomaculum nigrificans CO-1-SRB]|uniref:Ribosomal protein L14E n=1 Tax=Desulfotomaculum nigrificans (strain DSM 14880 / VKM B-2319 / CO-1-SRB) TaxID=868595 RepID=F6B5R5_DESCC|nr:KOW domain-containing RNA-binding protein [Desulfotomaculum nigrificans]AEF93138.1 ribosomal protein L14E [Desulfotomaculum nigrificans CO-1-SRB]
MQGLVEEVRPGQLVSSTQGRDAGRYYLVISSLGDNFVLVTDGEFRGVEKPKKKNLKHLKIWPMVSEKMQDKLAAQSKLTNSEVSSYLADMLSSIQE